MRSLLLIFSLSFLLTSCTKLDLMVGWADTFIMSSITDYFDLNSDDKAKVKTELKSVLQQIQKQDFPAYAEHLGKLADVIEKNELNPTFVAKYLGELESLIFKSGQRFEPFAQNLVSMQAKTNFEEFDEKFASRQKENFEKAESVKKLAKESRKKMNRWVNETVEFLTEEQERSYNELLLNHPVPMRLLLESRQSVFEKFKIARAQPETRQKFIQTFFYNWESLQTPVYLEARKAQRERHLKFLIQLASDLNPKQKQNFVKNLRKRAVELNSLSER